MLEQISAQQIRDDDDDVHHSGDEEAAPKPALSQKPQAKRRGSCTCEWTTPDVYMWIMITCMDTNSDDEYGVILFDFYKVQ